MKEHPNASTTKVKNAFHEEKGNSVRSYRNAYLKEIYDEGIAKLPPQLVKDLFANKKRPARRKKRPVTTEKPSRKSEPASELEGMTLLERFTVHLNNLMLKASPTSQDLAIVERYLDKVGEFDAVNPELEVALEERMEDRGVEELVQLALGERRLEFLPEEDLEESSSPSLRSLDS